MLQSILIGNVGADAQVQSKDGREFTTFRVAHNDRWTDQAGTEHNSTIWVDCIMSGSSNVVQYIKQGATVCVMGNVKLRVYSSEKDRCMKCGMTINVNRVELIGGRPDAVPSRLYDSNGVQHDVQKFFHTDVANTTLINMRSERFVVNQDGWVAPESMVNPDATQVALQQQQQQAQQLQQQQSQQQEDNAPVF